MSERTDAELERIFIHGGLGDYSVAGDRKARRALYEAGHKDGYQQGWNDRAAIDDKMVSKAIQAFGDIVFDDGGSVQGFRMSVATRAALEAALGVNCKEGGGP